MVRPEAQFAQALSSAKSLAEERTRVLSDTQSFAEAMGLSVYDAKTGRVPWMLGDGEIHQRVCELMDRIVREIDNPIKIVAIPRGHFKTTILGSALSRIHFKKPSGRSAIFAAKGDLSRKSLKQVSDIWKSDEAQRLFGDLLFPVNNKEAYQNSNLSLNAKRIGGEPSIMAFGMESSFTGFHFDTVLWVDDLIDKHMAKSIPEMEAAFESLKDLVGCVADPGCEVWLSFTRYNINDPYGDILPLEFGGNETESPYKNNIVADPIVEDCVTTDEDGNETPIFKVRFCCMNTEVGDSVEYQGEVIDVPRKSFENLKLSMGPRMFSSQYRNRPTSDEDSPFEREWFDSVLDCDGQSFFEWISNKENARSIAPFPEDGERGPYEVGVFGDPAYGDKKHNDSACLWVIVADRFNHRFFLEYSRMKYGKLKLGNYCRKAIGWYRDFTDLCTERRRSWLAIETHGSGVMLEADILRVEIEMGIRCKKFDLKDNTNQKKEFRIMTLETPASNRWLHFCNNVESGRQQLILEAMTYMSGGTDDVIDTAANQTQVFQIRRVNKPKQAPMHSFRGASRRTQRFLSRRAS